MVGNAGRTTYFYYACRGNSHEYEERRCREPRINAREAESLIWSKVAEGLQNPQLLTQQYAIWHDKHPSKSKQASNRLVQVVGELDRLTKKRDRCLEAFIDGMMDRSELGERQNELQVQQRILEQEKKALDNLLHEPEQIEANLESFNKFCSNISHRLDELTFEEKQKILRLLNIHGRIYNKRVYLSGCIPSWEREKFDYSAVEPDQLP